METSIGGYLADVERAAAELERADVVGRIWRKDYTVWQPNPEEVTNRLGWLDLPCLMPERVPELVEFAGEIRQAGFRHVVLLGMGGSSLGPLVLQQTFGSRQGYPELMVLDSTLPEVVRAVTEKIEPERTLFLVSSKSGTTMETNTLHDYFREVVGGKKDGQNFAAITDPGTQLAERAAQEGFRQIFLNQPDIGGRYAVMSLVGLVPAALMGIDLEMLLSRADGIRRGCSAGTPLCQNPGAWLGVIMGQLALSGRDKLTLLTSPAIARFGLWVEQLVAESTGKAGRGIIPVIGEPVMEPVSYGDDRLFVYLRLAGDDNSAADAAVEQLKSAGQPVVRLDMADRYDLGGEFYRWEMATAVAGAMLEVNPFNQPDVEMTKRATDRLLRILTGSGEISLPGETGSLAGLLRWAGEGSYLAILAYLSQTGAADDALAALRRKVSEKYKIATTLGYGPRYLHSTGQLHKGGPDTGLFLQLTIDHESDLPVPGKPYNFGRLADVQAMGDREALQELGRHVVRHHVDEPTDISRLI